MSLWPGIAGRKAVARVCRCAHDAVHAYARHRLTPRADPVDDVVQDVLVGSLNGLGAFQGRSSHRTRLIAIAPHKIEMSTRTASFWINPSSANSITCSVDRPQS
jgi:DNA-directed RNA polymerase specialized sigma24 family protein